jgi:hypothetical protein
VKHFPSKMPGGDAWDVRGVLEYLVGYLGNSNLPRQRIEDAISEAHVLILARFPSSDSMIDEIARGLSRRGFPCTPNFVSFESPPAAAPCRQRRSAGSGARRTEKSSET